MHITRLCTMMILSLYCGSFTALSASPITYNETSISWISFWMPDFMGPDNSPLAHTVLWAQGALFTGLVSSQPPDITVARYPVDEIPTVPNFIAVATDSGRGLYNGNPYRAYYGNCPGCGQRTSFEYDLFQTTTPEPGTWFLTAIGLLFFGLTICVRATLQEMKMPSAIELVSFRARETVRKEFGKALKEIDKAKEQV